MSNNLVYQVFELENLFREEEEKGSILRKSSKVSEETRQHGNKLYAKKIHNQDVHKDILLQYTKSILFAPKGSEELALGFSNRSALLLHLQRYEDCLTDIDRALAITKSDQLKMKLETRKKACKKRAKFLENATKNLKLDDDKLIISMTPSKTLKSAAESVTLKYNQTFGKHLIANRNIKPGEIVVAEKGYACFPKFRQIYLVCSHCLSFAWNAVPCDFCVFTVYCNETCKNEAWKEYHDVECPLLKFMRYDNNIYTVDVVLAARIFIKAVKAEGFHNVMNETQLRNDVDGVSRLLSNGVLDSNTFRSCYNQHSRSNYRLMDTNGHLYEIIIIYLLIKKTNILPLDKNEDSYNVNDEKMLLQLKNIFIKLRDIQDMCAFSYQSQKCNCKKISVCQEKCDSIRGTLVAPCGSLINHSCLPNVGRFFIQDRKIVFYATRPIKKGEQLFTSYGVNVLVDAGIRQEFIQRNFHFTCSCSACNDKKTMIRGFNNKELFGKILFTLVMEFQRIYKDKAMSSPFLALDPKYWTVFNKELLEQALTVIEVIYSHFDVYTAYNFCIQFQIYILDAFCRLYSENCVMPDQC